MDAFVTRQYYETTYKGTSVPAIDFPALAIQASYEVDAVTFRRASATIKQVQSLSLIDDIQMATCAVVDALYQNNQQAANSFSGITSEKVGDYSRNFASASEATIAQKQMVYSAVERYLSMSGLLSRWI
jgi:hypothetical protein